MPTYRYRCEGCGEDFEVWQSITDDALTTHDASTGDGGCAGHLVKVLSPAGIVLKGSGFYKTDSRGKRSSSKNGDGSSDSDSKDSGSSDSGSSDSGSKDSGSKDSGSKDSGSKKSDAKSDSSSGSGTKSSSGTSGASS